MKKNIIIGFTVLASLTALFLGINFLKGKQIFNKERIFYALYDKVDGLSKSDKVTIKGFKVGHISEVKFTDQNASKLLVAFTVDGNYNIPQNTIAQIVTTDIMGSRSLELEFPEVAEKYAHSGDTLRGTLSKGLKEEVSAQVLPIKAKAEELMSSLDTLLVSAHTVLGSNSQQNLIASIESMSKTFKHLEKATGNLEDIIGSEKGTMVGILKNFESITQNLKQNEDEISNILTNFSSLTDTLVQADVAGTLIETQRALQEFADIMKSVNKGEGSAGAFLTDRGLYNQMENAATNLNRLMSDIRLNPKKYVSFSLLKTGKTIYQDTDIKALKESDTFYRIQIFYMSEPVALENSIFKGRTDITETKIGKNKYRYTVGYTNDYKKLNKLLKKVRKDFPDAYIIEDEQGK